MPLSAKKIAIVSKGKSAGLPGRRHLDSLLLLAQALFENSRPRQAFVRARDVREAGQYRAWIGKRKGDVIANPYHHIPLLRSDNSKRSHVELDLTGVRLNLTKKLLATFWILECWRGLGSDFAFLPFRSPNARSCCSCAAFSALAEARADQKPALFSEEWAKDQQLAG
jgi:hypothetical protein